MRWFYYLVAIPLTLICLGLAIFTFTAASRPYEPIQFYEINAMPDKACRGKPIKVYVRAFISPPVENIIVDATWVRIDSPRPEYYEEPVAEFTDEELPVRINKISPVNHLAPFTPGVWVLTENLTAEGSQGVLGRTHDYETEDPSPLIVEECQ